MKLGNQQGCSFDDRIDFELSPSDVEHVISLLERQALSCNNYGDQGLWRKIKDEFQDRHDEWRQLRDKRDKR